MVTDQPVDPAFWQGRRVFVTGHTGFKGGWLCLWLHSMGARVHGYALPPPTDPNLFEVARIQDTLASHTFGDVRDYDALARSLVGARPEVVFHLAAQPLVRDSYRRPLETYAVNVMGTVHVLEAVRVAEGVKAVINVTSDKCYENREWPWGYREHDPMGGHDPYSSSKGCSELATAAYRRSFLADAGVAVATARAGNVIGGGDWGAHRLLPDFFRALDAGTPLAIRSPQSIRPWQHVLEPVAGYLALAEHLHRDGVPFAEPWNFGPGEEDAQSVEWIVDYMAAREPGSSWRRESTPQPHEASCLRLDSGKARARLAWRPRWRLETALDKTLDWHAAWRSGQDMQATTRSQIHEYVTGPVQAGYGAV
jgi:CDP-glucose 4,6-dehydratase